MRKLLMALIALSLMTLVAPPGVEATWSPWCLGRVTELTAALEASEDGITVPANVVTALHNAADACGDSATVEVSEEEAQWSCDGSMTWPGWVYLKVTAGVTRTYQEADANAWAATSVVKDEVYTRGENTETGFYANSVGSGTIYIGSELQLNGGGDASVGCGPSGGSPCTAIGRAHYSGAFSAETWTHKFC